MKEKKMIQKRKKKFLVFAMALSMLCIPAFLTPIVEAQDWDSFNLGEEVLPGTVVEDNGRHGYYISDKFPVEYYDKDGNEYTDLSCDSEYDSANNKSYHTVKSKEGVRVWKVHKAEGTGHTTLFALQAVPYDHSVTYKSEGTVLQTSYADDGDATPLYGGATPSKVSDAQYDYTFAGWDAPIAATLTQDLVYNATYSKKLREYPITWQDDEGNELDITKVAYGTVPTHADPTKAATDEYTYTFKGWDADPVAVTGPATYKAVFEAIPVSKQAEVKTTAATTAATTEAKDSSAPTGDRAPLAAAGALALASFFGAAALLLKKKA